jgi:hypothetical protein
MKRGFLILVCAVLVAVPVSAQTIGENFQGKGVAFWGSGNVHFNLGNVLEEGSEWNYFEAFINPGASFYVADYVSIQTGLNGSFAVDTENRENISRTASLGLGLGMSYDIVPDPEAQTGTALSVGGRLGVRMVPGVSDTVNGTTVEDKSMLFDISVAPAMRLYQFLQERIALYVEFSPILAWWVDTVDSAGDPIEHPDFFTNETQLKMDLSFGISWFSPRADVTLVE